MKNLQTKRLDHLDIVMGTIKECNIMDIIDEKIGVDVKQKITTGESVAAMVMSGLGFVNRPLFLTHQFFETKALDLLFDKEVASKDLNRHRLGRALDKIHEYGCELLFSEIATEVISLDTSSFPVSDEHETNGHAKAHRPDLKQAILELVTTQDGVIPLMMRCCDVNASDNVIFKDRCEYLLQSFKASDAPRYLVGDSKLYHEKNAKNLWHMKFITRIPSTYEEGKKAIETAITENQWNSLSNENKYYEHRLNHFEMEQRWLVVYSKAAERHAKETIARQSDKEYKATRCALKHLRNKEFCCENDAKDALNQLSSHLKYHTIIADPVVPRDRYEGKGRPKKTDKPVKTIFQITGSIASLIENRKKILQERSCYVIGTNTSDLELSSENVIEAYKNQNARIERGFRFLKDPQFLASSFFLKKPSRIMALLMVMTLSLLIYSIAQRRLRSQLQEKRPYLIDAMDLPIN